MEKLEEISNINVINCGLPFKLHIASVIFSKLSIISLPTCRLVCKSWNHLVLNYASSSPKIRPNSILLSSIDFLPFNYDFGNPKLHCFDIDTLSFVAPSTLVSPDVESLSIYNCCNGLLFVERGLRIDGEGIFNPMTNEFFPTPICELHHTLFTGFGFSPNTQQYKLFRARDSCELQILRFGRNNNQWASVCMPFSVTLECHGVYMDGSIYWIGKDQKESEHVIYALDVETERFEVIALLEVGPYAHAFQLQPLNGTIYAIIFMNKPYQIQVWRMQKKDSWIRDFILPGAFRDTAIDLLKVSDGKVFLRIINNLFCLDNYGEKTKRNKLVQITNNILETINNSLRVMINEWYSLDTTWKRKIKTLIPFNRQFSGICVMESLHFGSLPSILSGGGDY